ECGACFHEDGGRGAVFIESSNETVPLSPGVALGPGFRVVACDCGIGADAAGATAVAAGEEEFCEFCCCACNACGGGFHRRR
ncbi:unnamed protein product, partial [Phaeothamnion confervicola]